MQRLTRHVSVIRMTTRRRGIDSSGGSRDEVMRVKHQARYQDTTVRGSPYSITERRVPELIPVLGSQPTGDVSHKPDAGAPTGFFSRGS